MPLKRGSLYRFNYLWSREHSNGEVSGRKARPACLVVRSSTTPAVLYLFPVTSREPPADVIALAISKGECRFASLDHPSWIVIEEYNRVDETELYDFESLTPIGQFSPSFMLHIAAAIKRAAQLERLTGVPRT
jgi:hypothetical protein